MTAFADLLASPTRRLGTWSQIAAPEVIDMIGLNGFDFIVIDCQHGPFGIAEAERMARAAAATGLAAAVRVSRLDEVEIMKALDAGISHVVVPDVANAEQAARAVAATRFGPEGARGACPCVRSGGHFVRDWQGYVAREEGRTGIVALVESAEGVANAEAICATPGLAAVMAGPFDLSVSMGLGGDWRDARVTQALERLVALARENGLPAIMPVFSPDPEECRALAAHWQARGVSILMIGSDKILIANAFEKWTGALGG
ncbi:MAG: aldolase/citrate lyase family protein [Roseovarius sp.]